ncbi:Ribonuclease HI [Candidatus Arcanobacter lacustris]|uniref:Ribonuclease H n=1 Tax=Candidatus Arcanibacter lacustris TaxID=1607817 RepID=A0A0F5MQB9_9RICK|nr:Ribonuclease HI [Candidatus Arcanobacter lacustris]
MKKIVEIYTDGACSGNPGPGGWGALLICGDATKEIYGLDTDTTNNKMELLAAINALKSLKNPCQIELYTDSVYVRDGITKWIISWKAKGWKKSTKGEIKNLELWQELDHLVKDHQINWHWVKAHNGNVGNEIADKLAVRGRDEAIALSKR